MSRPTTSSRPAWAGRELVVVCAATAILLLATSSQYGPHRDELYFAAAGHHLAWGYPDQPSFTPLLGRLAQLIAPGNLVVLRLPSLLAVLGLVVVAAGFARLLGGGRGAQTLTAATVAASAYTVSVGHRLSTATFDVLVWAGLLLITGYLLTGHDRRLWLIAGVVAGLGLHNKHAVVVLLAAILLAFALDKTARRQLASPYPWLGGGIAMIIWLPNLVWQAANGWPALALSSDIADEYGGLGGRVELVAQALLIFSPVIAVVWVLGLVQLFRRRAWRPLRPIGMIFVITTAVFVITGGKGYYLAGAIVPLIAVGGTDLARRWRSRRVALVGVALALSAMVAWPAVLPLLPASTYAASFYPALDENQLETLGWPEYVATVRAAADAVPLADRAGLVVVTQNYGEAGALEWYGFPHPVFSGHNGYGDWGPPPDGAAPVIVVGYAEPDSAFVDCRQQATIGNDAGADNEEAGRPIWICSGPRQSWSRTWPSLKRLRA